MTDAVVDGVVRWVERRILKDGVVGVHAGLFGGEPLMRARTCLALMDGINELGSRYGVETSYYSSSNALLLTDELARDLARRRLTQLQISIDGPEEIHDARRVGHKGQGTFRKTLAAIKLAVEYIPSVTVKINFDRHNRLHVEKVFDLLVEEALRDRVNVKLEAIAYQFADSQTRHDRSFPIPPESPELADAYIELMQAASDRGIAVSRDTAHTTPCMFTAEHGVLIGPEGEIYKCISLVGRAEYVIGSVFEEDYRREAYNDQMNAYKRIEDCFSERCPYIPVCGGGCAYESIIRTGSYSQRFCTKNYLAEFHYKRNLLRHVNKLVNMGMRPLSSDELHSSMQAPAGPERGPAAFIPLSSLTRRH